MQHSKSNNIKYNTNGWIFQHVKIIKNHLRLNGTSEIERGHDLSQLTVSNVFENRIMNENGTGGGHREGRWKKKPSKTIRSFSRTF